jgi:hypothetical protein
VDNQEKIRHTATRKLDYERSGRIQAFYRYPIPGMGEADGVNIRDKAGIAYLKLLDVLGED